MDGEAVMAAFATCSGPDCIKDVIRTFGTRLKIYNMIKTAIQESYKHNVSDSEKYQHNVCVCTHARASISV